MARKSKLELEASFSGQESRMKAKMTRKVEYLDIDESLIELEKDSELIRMDMNTIELPIFSKDTRRKANEIRTYYFKTDKSSYLEIEPLDGYTIPGDFEERVFIALTKIMRDNGYIDTFWVTASEILESVDSNLTKKGNTFNKLKKAIKTLANTKYRFMNCLYSNQDRCVFKNEIDTMMMDIRIVTREDKNADRVDQFEDGRVKEVYEISFSKYFYNNIISKGYLVYDSNALLEMNSITRALHIMIEKWRNYKLEIIRPAFFIARRIPLRWDKSHVSRTIKIIEKACLELKDKGLIKDYSLNKKSKWELAEFSFFFEEKHNKNKSTLYHDEKVEYGLDIEIVSQKQSIKHDDVIAQIFQILPPVAKTYKSMPKAIQKAITKKGYAYAEYAAKKTALAKKIKKSVLAYFKSLTEGNEDFDREYDEYIASRVAKQEQQVKVKQQQEEIKQKQEVEEAQIVEENDKYWDIFLTYSEEEQEEIKQDIINSYPKVTQNLIAKSLANEKSAKPIIIDYVKTKDIQPKVVETPKEESNGISIEKEYSNISMYLFDSLNELKNIGVQQKDIQTILEILPMLKFFDGELNGYQISLKFDDESKIGTIGIKEVI